MPSRMTRFGAITVLLVATAASGAEAEGFAGKRWALLIGVDQYKRLTNLEYCGEDVRALGATLGTAGFERDRIVVLHNKGNKLDMQPLKTNIEEQIDLILGSAKAEDLVVLSFSGHGVRLADKSYLCPYEANLDDPGTLIPLNMVFKKLEECPAALKLFLVDACQNDILREGERAATGKRSVEEFAKSLNTAPKGTLLLTSCAPGQRSQEAAEFKHGVFMHYLLEGLVGPADSNTNGAVTLMELFAYASDRTQTYVRLNYKALQQPALRGAIVDFPLVESVMPREMTNSIGMRLVLIPAGEFLMGSAESAEDLVRAFPKHGDHDATPDCYRPEFPRHRVRITKPFYLGQYEVTVGQFRKFVEDASYRTDAEKDGKGGYGYNASTDKWEQKPEYTWRKPDFEQGDEHPVVNISWNDAVAFCEWLSRKEGRTYRLPTEAQWEYGCRAGTTRRYYNGDDPEKLAEIANVADASAKAKFSDWKSTIEANDGYVFTAPLGRFRPNAFGLYDMHGNALEWCADWYSDAYYATSPTDDPAGPDSGVSRVLRGGSWSDWLDLDRSASRCGNSPENRFSITGFRVSRTP